MAAEPQGSESKDAPQGETGALVKIIPSLATPIHLAGYSILAAVIILRTIIAVKSQALDLKTIGVILICVVGILALARLDIVSAKQRGMTLILIVFMLCSSICLLVSAIVDYTEIERSAMHSNLPTPTNSSTLINPPTQTGVSTIPLSTPSAHRLQVNEHQTVAVATPPINASIHSHPASVVNQPFETRSPEKIILGFSVTNAGLYYVVASANVPNTRTNAFLVNIDSLPVAPAMIWDVPPTSGFKNRVVAWRGNGTPATDEFVPKYFELNEGKHELIIWGAGVNSSLKGIQILKVPSPPLDLRVILN